MMGGTTTTTQQQQQNQTQPWAPAQPMLQGILSQLNGVQPGVNALQTGAIGTLTANALNAPSYAAPVQNLANDLFSGGPDRTGRVAQAFDALQSNLGPTAAGQTLDPNRNPYLRGALDTVLNDVTQNVNSQFAAAGRDLSGYNQQALARGVAQAEAPLIMNQYNTERANQMNAVNALYNAGVNTATTLSGLDRTALANRLQGLGVANALPALEDQSANRILAAQAQGYGLPLQQIGLLENLGMPIAQLGSQSSGTSLGTTSQSVPVGPSLLGATLGGLGLLGKMGFFGGLGGATG
jgi:hypothetical protein